MTDFILGVFEITIGMSLFIALLLIGLKLFGSKFTAKCRYIIWALVMIRLAIPFSFGLLPTLIEIPIDTELVQSEDLSSVLLENTDPVTSVHPSDPGNIAVNPTVPSTPVFPNVDSVNPDNTPFRTDDGELLFRPAGHGALIENLNDIDADIIFVKNIDNVTTDARRGDTVKYKKALAGMLLELQAKTFGYLRSLESGEADLDATRNFIEKELCVKLPAECDAEMMKAVLNRPIRVCGVVRNQGEPGGGPFWVAAEDGTESLQIAESSQISPDDMHLMKSATHFNPVDLVCGVKNYKGEKFDLTQYTDPATGFISSKSSGGRELRAQELPGLWNGAMAKWNTVLVEVPITTFSPVKVVQDLLRPEHQ